MRSRSPCPDIKNQSKTEKRRRRSDNDVILEATIASGKIIHTESTLIQQMKNREKGIVYLKLPQ